MSDLQPLQGVLIVAEAAAASVLLPPMAWLLAKAWRRSAAGRRLVWITAFAMLLVLPLLAMVSPSLAVIALPAPSPDLAAAPAIAAADPGPRGLGWPDAIPVAVAVWLAGLAKLTVEHLVALVRLELMRRRATAWPGPVPVRARGCVLLMSEDCPGPMTWGVLRPVIMLPEEALDWTTARLATVLRHELAHVRRRDGLAQALALVACALYWPNPLVWGAARGLRREAELAADDAVIAAGVLPSDYAGQLLELASEWRERRLTPTGLAMAAPPALSQRVQSILSTDAIRTGATAMDTLKLALIGGVATAALTLARPSVAEIAVGAPPRAAEAASRADLQLAEQAVQAAPAEAKVEVQPAPPAAAAAAASPSAAAQPAPAAPPAAPRPPRFSSGRVMSPEQRAELDRQLAEIGPRIQRAIADAHIHERVAQRLAEIQPQIEAAMAQARENGRRASERAAQAEERAAARLDEQARRARERAQRDRERLAEPQPAQPPTN